MPVNSKPLNRPALGVLFVACLLGSALMLAGGWPQGAFRTLVLLLNLVTVATTGTLLLRAPRH